MLHICLAMFNTCFLKLQSTNIANLYGNVLNAHAANSQNPWTTLNKSVFVIQGLFKCFAKFESSRQTTERHHGELIKTSFKKPAHNMSFFHFPHKFNQNSGYFM